MYKVLIADDEVKVCQLVQKIINWNELGFEVCAIAKNGFEAYNIICEKLPDIVITDIRMPGYDGIELVKLTHEKEIYPYFIILSGYSHFEYARDAIKYGVENYLLKPISKNELIETLDSIKKKLENSKVRAEESNCIKELLKNSTNKMHQLFVNNVLKGVNDYTNFELESINDYYQLNFREGYFQVVNIKLDNYIDNVIDVDAIFIKFNEIILNVLGDACYEIFSDDIRSSKIVILNYDLSKKVLINNLIKELFKKLLCYIQVFQNFNITIGIGIPRPSLFDLTQSFIEAKSAVNCRISLGANKIIDYESLRYENVPISSILTTKKKQQLLNIFEVLDAGAFEQWIIVLYSSIHLFKEHYPSLQYDIAEEISNIVINAFLDMGMDWENKTILQEQILELLDNTVSENVLIDKLVAIASKQMEIFSQDKRIQDNKPIRLAKQFIAENFSKPISLEQVADIVHMSTSYFSYIFKRETGINFIDYLINYRINESKELLKKTDFNLSEIAERLGYSDPKYFSKLFYKVIGIKPSEYRKLNS